MKWHSRIGEGICMYRIAKVKLYVTGLQGQMIAYLQVKSLIEKLLRLFVSQKSKSRQPSPLSAYSRIRARFNCEKSILHNVEM